MGYGPGKLYGLWGTTNLWVLIGNRRGGAQNVWVRANYGLGELWVRRASTVVFKLETGEKIRPVKKRFFFLQGSYKEVLNSRGCPGPSRLGRRMWVYVLRWQQIVGS
jgi:hypothetical protein